jgi:hypothetical protein
MKKLRGKLNVSDPDEMFGLLCKNEDLKISETKKEFGIDKRADIDDLYKLCKLCNANFSVNWNDNEFVVEYQVNPPKPKPSDGPDILG